MSDWKWHPERAEGDRWVEAGAPEPETTLLSAATPADILTAGGILRATEVVELAAAAGLDLAAAAVVLLKESGGGRNVWGHDGVIVAPNTYIKGAEVTEQAYRAYLQAVTAGRAGRQGCGPMQLTWSGYQAQADALGGCWDWRNNVTVGFQALAQHIRNSGLRGGFRDYNGSGPAAEAYATDAMTKYDVWRVRLGTPDPAGAGDMTPADSQKLDEIHQQLLGVMAAWGGGVTDAQGTPYNALQFAMRTNVEIHQTALMCQQLLKRAQAKPPGMLRSDVNEIAATIAQHPAIAALVDTGEMTTVSFWKATAERLVRAFAVSMLSLLGAGVIDIVHVPWTTDLSISGGAAVASLLASLVASQVGDPGSPSFLKGKQ
ncbi:MAG: hypothetical protein JWO11_3516 [Nocardioides sp.]|nr:hypothetical protein [Nocardioides sp.]